MRKALTYTIAMLTAAAAAAQEPVDYKYNEFYYQRATLFDLLPIEETDIVMLGNSLTNGCEWHELLNMPNVKNRGVSSDVIQGVYDRLPSIINGHPAKIFLLTGVNDVSHHLSTDSIVTAYGALIDHIRAELPETELYVQSMLPINNSFGRYRNIVGKEQQIRDINQALAATAEAKGFTWIDLYPLFADCEGNLRADLTNDGLHLLGPGYLIWRDAILPYLTQGSAQ